MPSAISLKNTQITQRLVLQDGMNANNSPPPTVPLPSCGNDTVRAATIHVISTAQFAAARTRGCYRLYTTFDIFGPKVSHAVAKSVMRRSPIHKGCGPGGASVARLL